MKHTPIVLMPVLLATLVLVGPTPAQTREEPAYADEYVEGDFARVMYVDGGATVRRAVVDPAYPGEQPVGVNAPIFPGDSLVTAADERTEIQLAGGTLIRVDRLSEMTLLALPSPSAEFSDHTVLQLAEGSFRLTAVVSDDEEFRIDTPAGSIYLFDDGEFRIDVDRDGTTRLTSRRGVAELSGEGGSVLVLGGTYADLYPGAVPEGPTAFNTFSADDFDRWVGFRDEALRRQDRYAGGQGSEVYGALPEEVRPYYRELDGHGDWIYTDEYGYVWSPSGVAASWRPYADGGWYYGPRGYFWVGAEPWGWAPYHYGRWSHVGARGWCWIPGRVFGGAWVAWSWGSLHVGWGPLDYWNRPAYYGPVHYGYYDYRCWTFVSYTHFHRPRYHHYAVRGDHLGDALQYNAIVTRPPRVAPARIAASRESAQAAFASARGDLRSRVRPVDPGRRPAESMVDVENRVSRLGVERRTRARAETNGSRTSPGAPSRIGGGTRPHSTTPRLQSLRSPQRTRATDPAAAGSNRSPRRSVSGRGVPTPPSATQRPSGSRTSRPSVEATTRNEGARRRVPAGATGRPAPQAVSPRRNEPDRRRTVRANPPAATSPRAGSGSRLGPERSGAARPTPRSRTPDAARSSEGQRTTQRMRSLYEQMSRPRTTRSSASTPARPSTPTRGGNRAAGGRSNSPTRPRATPPRSSGGGGGSTGARSGGSSGSTGGRSGRSAAPPSGRGGSGGTNRGGSARGRSGRSSGDGKKK